MNEKDSVFVISCDEIVTSTELANAETSKKGNVNVLEKKPCVNDFRLTLLANGEVLWRMEKW